MTQTLDSLSPQRAWEPLAPSLWNEESAAHLLRRMGFSATPEAIQKAMYLGQRDIIEYYFGKNRPMDIPYRVEREAAEKPELRKEIPNTEKDSDERRELYRSIRQLEQAAYQNYTIDWLAFAREPENSAQEKYVLFLQDIFVVGQNKVRSGVELYNHQALLREMGYGAYPDMVKAVSRSPAMIRYLDIQRNSKNSPNENFARELFELFTLGEGNYTEKDIKQAARAFTGYRLRQDEFIFVKSAHDEKHKTVFGQTGPWNGDDVIDIVYQQPAAATFVPREFLRFYVSEDPLPEAYVEALGGLWANSGYDMRFLIKTVFSSQLFYLPEYQGNMIKSPIHYYIGLCQDLKLNVTPFPTKVMSSLRSMGQMFYNPPNVRGWVGGKHWINTTTFAARRQLAQILFIPIDEERLNADDLVELNAARAEGKDAFVVSDDRLAGLQDLSPEQVAQHFCVYFLPSDPPPGFQETLARYLESAPSSKYIESIKDVTIAILQSPQYQLS